MTALDKIVMEKSQKIVEVADGLQAAVEQGILLKDLRLFAKHTASGKKLWEDFTGRRDGPHKKEKGWGFVDFVQEVIEIVSNMRAAGIKRSFAINKITISAPGKPSEARALLKIGLPPAKEGHRWVFVERNPAKQYVYSEKDDRTTVTLEEIPKEQAKKAA